MKKRELATIVLAIVVGSAVSIYIRRGSASLVPPEIFVDEKTGSLNLLREPREIPDISFSDGDGRPLKPSAFREKWSC